MAFFKIIEDKTLDKKWLVKEDGITKNIYLGAIFWSTTDKCSTPIDINLVPTLSTKELGLLKKIGIDNLDIVCNKKSGVGSIARDIIRPLTLKEYMLLNNTLKFLGFTYNKKTEKLTCLKS